MVIFGHFRGVYSYYTVIDRIPRLLCMMVQYAGMPQYQKILRLTQFVGCKAKNRQTSRHFDNLWPFLGCYSYHTVIVKLPRLLCMMNQYVGMHQFQKILRWTEFVRCRAKNRQTTRKKGIWVIYGHFGGVEATIR